MGKHRSSWIAQTQEEWIAARGKSLSHDLVCARQLVREKWIVLRKSRDTESEQLARSFRGIATECVEIKPPQKSRGKHSDRHTFSELGPMKGSHRHSSVLARLHMNPSPLYRSCCCCGGRAWVTRGRSQSVSHRKQTGTRIDS